MLKPPVPENEEARLSALRELEILDTEIEERYVSWSRFFGQVGSEVKVYSGC